MQYEVWPANDNFQRNHACSTLIVKSELLENFFVPGKLKDNKQEKEKGGGGGDSSLNLNH